MQEKIKKKRGRWKKGESGNPAGRTKDPRKLAVIEIFKNAAPELLEKAIEEALAGDKYLLGILVKKALPDNVNFNVFQNEKELTDAELMRIARIGSAGITKQTGGSGESDTVH